MARVLVTSVASKVTVDELQVPEVTWLSCCHNSSHNHTRTCCTNRLNPQPITLAVAVVDAAAAGSQQQPQHPACKSLQLHAEARSMVDGILQLKMKNTLSPFCLNTIFRFSHLCVFSRSTERLSKPCCKCPYTKAPSFELQSALLCPFVVFSCT